MANEVKLKTQLENISEFFARYSPAVIPEAIPWVEDLLPHAKSGHELILGEREKAAGLLLKSDQVEFWKALDQILAAKGAPENVRTALRDLSEAAEFKNGYCKLEWPGQGAVAGKKAKASVYFRRRFALDDANQFLIRQGISEQVRERIGLFAELLQKSKLHFLAASVEEGKPLTWKAYFTQWVDRVSYAVVIRRLLTLMELQSVSPDTAGVLMSAHSQLMPYGKERTLFISLSFTETAIKPEVKLDYQKVNPQAIMHLISPDRREEEYARIVDLIHLTGGSNLSYLGVRLQQQPGLQLKYYSDSEGF